ncbi:MAG: DUF1735 domain-containing protein [Bacteroidales bacterium]|jgi:hypothetical protein|nr:DUF1735 domain-containing protein [Bacteroidales bacterium]
MKTKFIFMLCVAAAGLSAAWLSSCRNDGIPESLEFEQFKYFYFPSAKKVNKIIFNAGGSGDSVVRVEGLRYGGTTNFNQGEIRAEIGAAPSLVASYNSANNTAFLPLPEECYELSGASQVIKNGKNYSAGGSLTFKNIAALDPDREYLLPVTILSVGESNIPTNDELKTLWWSVSIYVEQYWPVPAKSQWRIEDFSSVHTTSGYEADKIIDGDPNTCWHSRDLTPPGWIPQWVIIDFTTIATISEIRFTARQSPHSWDTFASPKNIKFEISDYQTDWTLLLNVPELPNVQEEQTLPVPSPKSGRYLKITILTNWASQGYSYIGEISVN